MTQMSNTLTAESKVYASRAKDLQRQVGFAVVTIFVS